MPELTFLCTKNAGPLRVHKTDVDCNCIRPEMPHYAQQGFNKKSLKMDFVNNWPGGFILENSNSSETKTRDMGGLTNLGALTKC